MVTGDRNNTPGPGRTQPPASGGQAELALVWRPRGVSTVPQHQVPPLPDDLQRWIARTCAAVVEVAAGVRPAKQLFRVVRPGPLEQLQRRSRVRPSGNGPVRRVTSLRVSQTSAGVLEASAVVEGSQRFQAVALQLRRVRGTWQVTAVEIR